MKDLFLSDLYKDIYRYGNSFLLQKELLSTHIYEVQIMSFKIAYKIKQYDKIDFGLLAIKGLVHDIDEFKTGDFPRFIKYYDKNTKSSLDNLADACVKDLSEELDPEIYDIWKDSKKGVEGEILKLCDILCVVRKVIHENLILGNKSLKDVEESLSDNLNLLIDFFTSKSILSDDSKRVIIELLEESKEIIDGLI